MKITTKLDTIPSNGNNFLQDYLTALGIEDIDSFLKPTKKCFELLSHYENINRACTRLHFCIEQKMPIYIVRDSDMDGDCSAAIMYNFLRSINVHAKILSHTGKQHGLEQWMIDEVPNKSLILIPDASATGEQIINTIREKECWVIETDHHNTDHEDDRIITVNNQRSPRVVNKALSGAGVTDKFVRKYCRTYKYPYPDYTDLVAVSLVSDVCDLSTLENRAYMYFGLGNIQNNFLKYLFEKLCQQKGYNSEGIGWRIAPLSNALARSDEQETKTVFFDGLIGIKSPEEALKEMRRVKRVQDANVKTVVDEIEPNLDVSSKVIVGFTQPETASYVGLIANKFQGKYHKPTILLRDTGTGAWSGSLRSPVPLLDKINESGIAKAQGHPEACGVIVKMKKLDEFKSWLETLDLSNKPSVEVTAKVNPNDITLDICQVIENYKQLFGHGIESPTFYISTIVTKDQVFVFEKSTTTIKIILDNLNCLKFFSTKEDVDNFMKFDKFRLDLIVGDLSINEWEGVQTPQCVIKDYEINKINDAIEDWRDSF